MLFNQNLTSTDLLCKNLIDGSKKVAVSDLYNLLTSTPPSILTYRVKLLVASGTYTGEGANAATYDNKWRWDKYASVGSSTTAPTLENFTGKTITTTNYYLDSATSAAMNIGDSYSAIATCYVYFEKATTVSLVQTSDDAGSLYIDSKLVATNESCKTTTTSYAFTKGEHKVQMCYTEGSGGDGWQVTPALYSIDGCKKMSAERIGYYSQTVTPTEGDLTKLTTSSIVLGAIPIFFTSKTINAQGDIKETLNNLIIVPAAKKITFYQNYGCLGQEIEAYVFVRT